MKRTIWMTVLAAFCMVLLPSHLSAQWKVGVNAGYAYNSYSIENNYAYDFHYGGRDGLTVGIPVEYGFFDWFAVRADLTYVQKGFSMERAYNETYRNRCDHYISLPLMARFSFGGEKLRGFLHAGGYVGYWMNSDIEGQELSATVSFDQIHNNEMEGLFVPYNKKYDFNSIRDNRFEAGLAGGIGISYQILPNIEIEAEGRCYYSLTSTTKDYMLKKLPRYNTTFALMAGLKYCF